MDWTLTLVMILGGLLVLMLTGMPVAICFMLINVVGIYVFWGEPGLGQLILSIFSSVSSFTFVAVPLFILMGEVIFLSGMGFRMLDILDKWLGRVPGRLGLMAVSGGTLFGLMSGSSMASVSLLGSVLVPEMEKRGYKKPMSIGPVIGSGGLAMIIPPSTMVVLLGALGNISIGKLLVGGLVPGLVLACIYASYVVGRCWLQPSVAPTYTPVSIPLSDKLRSTARDVLPLGTIIFLALGLIFLGIATPSEAAAAGAVGSLLLAAGYGKANVALLKKSLVGTVRITTMILMIIAGATAFTQILSYSGAMTGLVQLAGKLTIAPLLVIIVMHVILLFLGCFVSMVPVMMITLPIFMPIVNNLGFDPVWFGITMLINIEMAGSTPPFGMLLFVMKGVAPAGSTMGDIIRAGFPFLVCDSILMVLLFLFPQLVLWLPNLLL